MGRMKPLADMTHTRFEFLIILVNFFKENLLALSATNF